MKIRTDVVQGSLDWKIARLGKISASSSNPIVDGYNEEEYYADNPANRKVGRVGKIKREAGWTDVATSYAIQLASERIAGEMVIDEDEYVSPAMQHGLNNEPLARDIYNRSRKVEMKEVGGVEDGELWFSPDGLIEDDGIWECKCPQPKQHMRILLNDTVLDEYYHQLQFGLMVTGRKWADFMSFSPHYPDKHKAKVIRVERDEEYIEKLRTRCEQFNRLVEEMVKKVEG